MIYALQVSDKFDYPFLKQALIFTCLQYKFFENTVGKGEIARNEQFLLFPQCFQCVWRTFGYFYQILNCHLQSLRKWKGLKFVVWERVMEQIEPEHLELIVLEFRKVSESDFVYTRASANVNQSAPTLVKMYVTIRSRTRSIMYLIGPELFKLFPLEFAKIAESDFVYTIASTNVDQLVAHI